MIMKVANVTGWLGVWVCFTACAAQRSPEPSPPPSTPAAGVERSAAPGDPAAVPPLAAAPAPEGLELPKSKAARDEAEYSTLEAAERALNQAKADLDRLALAQPAPVLGHDRTTDRAAEKKSDSRPSTAGTAAPAKSNAVCEDACRAFSSLSRAASAVCRLDGSAGKHCSHAKQVQADAQQRVASCSCPASSD